ncbi:hypothetical protein HY949_03030 [Candidatus Gottesmanbacteria bacterium]|nr:hypothetical protein [Candidatus Gottesmanbacteria bacterium]
MTISLTSRITGKTMSMISLVALLIFLPLLLLAAYQTATIISRAAGTPADISIDAGTTTHEIIDPAFMRAFAQGGEETGNWLVPVQKEVAALKPKWIRIDHIYDFYDIVKKDAGRLSFDFSKLDPLIDSISATGATPVIALSYMPPAIAIDGKIINPPTDWNDWSLVVQKTIEHISGPAGKNISDVYYEVWNEPDHEQFGSWKLDGEKNYLTLYRYAAQGAGKASQTRPFSFGGPATTGLYKNWIIKLVESGDRLDFLSWHTYLDDPARFSLDQKNSTSWLIRYPEAVLLPKFITEFGFTGGRDTRYTTSFGAAHIAAVFRELAPAPPKGLFTFQLKDGPNQQGNTGWGLLTHETQGTTIKPRYRVFSLLERISGSRLKLEGEGTWVKGIAVKNGRALRVLLVNYDDGGNHTETVPLLISNLTNGTYDMRLQYLPEYAPQPSKTQELTITDGTLSRQLFMPAQTVVFLEISKR